MLVAASESVYVNLLITREKLDLMRRDETESTENTQALLGDYSKESLFSGTKCDRSNIQISFDELSISDLSKEVIENIINFTKIL